MHNAKQINLILAQEMLGGEIVNNNELIIDGLCKITAHGDFLFFDCITGVYNMLCGICLQNNKLIETFLSASRLYRERILQKWNNKND